MPLSQTFKLSNYNNDETDRGLLEGHVLNFGTFGDYIFGMKIIQQRHHSSY